MHTTFEIGAPIETLTQTELSTTLRSELDRTAQEWFQQWGRGVKYLRFGPVTATIASNAFSFDGSTGTGMGPRSGYVWSIRRLIVTGLGTGATPDVINFYRNAPAGIPLWQLNGNSFGSTFGKCELLLLDGEKLCFVNSGTVTATGTITVAGDVLEVAAEEISKLL